MNIFDNGKNATLAQVITDNPSTSYQAVDNYLSTNRAWFKGYCNMRKAKGLPYAKRNEIIWDLINMITDPTDSEAFEA